MTVRFQWRHNKAVEWTSLNPVLMMSEPGHEWDTGLFKLGDGFRHWNDLPYANGGTPVDPSSPVDLAMVEELIQDHIDSLTPHPVYDDGPSLTLFYENAKV